MISINAKKPLPVGISDYILVQSEYYYVDKTLLIKEFLDRRPLISLFTRPMGFGKTLNMDMLRVFFEISTENTRQYFEDKAIWDCGEEYRRQQGKYPVIFLTFKDVKFNTWQATLEKIGSLIQEEFARYMELAASEKLAEYERLYFTKAIKGESSEVDLTASLAKLSQMLAKNYGKAPVVIIDDYDVPIWNGASKNFGNKIAGFMGRFLSETFKDNKNLTYGFLTGVFGVAQGGIFGGFNNLAVNSVMDKEYDQFFGFTGAEVKEMLAYYELLDKEREMKEWYGGYLFGRTEIHNPWSVVRYISRGCVPQVYRLDTSNNEIIAAVLKKENSDILEKLSSLLRGELSIARIDWNICQSFLEKPVNVYNILLAAGYLKVESKELQSDGSCLCEVSIPNKEIAGAYNFLLKWETTDLKPQNGFLIELQVHGRNGANVVSLKA